MKQHKDKIRKAKPVVDTHAVSAGTRQTSLSRGSTEMSGGEDQLRGFLRHFHLQQYYKKLIELGFQGNIGRLAVLTDREIDRLGESLRFYPGHQGRFVEMLRYIRQVYISSRGRTRVWTAHSMSPQNLSMSPGKYHRALSHDSSGALLKQTGSVQTADPSHSDRDASLQLAEELARAKLKIMLLEHQLEQKTTAIPSETPPNVTKKSITFSIEEEKAADKPQMPKKRHEEVGVSYDSSKMRSTLINLDIEEICKCLSKAIKARVVHESEEEVRLDSQQRHSTRQSSASSLRYSDSRTLPLLPRLEEVFLEPERASYSSEETDIYNFTKNALIRAKMEKEVPVVVLVYLNRWEDKTGLKMTNWTWKRLLFTCMMLASKIWDDDSYENKHFAQAFSIYSIEEINAMESAFLTMLDFELNVKSGEYARAYFLLRTYFDPKNRSFPLKALDVETVRRLQGSVTKAEACLRDIHAGALFKTL